jgi:hypothetical protein
MMGRSQWSDLYYSDTLNGTWTLALSIPNGYSYGEIKFDNGIFAATVYGVITTSADGINWTTRSSVYGGSSLQYLSGGTWVCGNANYISRPRLVVSYDNAATWNTTTVFESLTQRILALGKIGSTLLAVSGDGIYRLPFDLSTFTTVQALNPVTTYATVAVHGDNVWVTTNGTDYRSTDGGFTFADAGIVSGAITGITVAPDGLFLLFGSSAYIHRFRVFNSFNYSALPDNGLTKTNWWTDASSVVHTQIFNKGVLTLWTKNGL